jgi:hypothetical protein
LFSTIRMEVRKSKSPPCRRNRDKGRAPRTKNDERLGQPPVVAEMCVGGLIQRQRVFWLCRLCAYGIAVSLYFFR